MEAKAAQNGSWLRSPLAFWIALEWLGLLAVFASFGGGTVPHVNEAHYLCKAKHFWNPEWCKNDLFFASSEAHLVFYILFGWLTRFFSLATTAWITRLICWGLLAFSWLRLSRSVSPKYGVALVTGWLFALLLERTHMSGEWVVGGAEAKVIAYVFVLLGLAEIVNSRWLRVWPLLGIAAAFHVLVGGWAVVAAMFAYTLSKQDRPKPLEMLPSLLVGFAFSAFGLVPGALLTLQAESNEAAMANQIYVFERLSHHLVFETFSRPHVTRHFSLAVIAIGLWLSQWKHLPARRLGGFAFAAFLIALTGVAIDLWRQRGTDPMAFAGLLKFYWFRLSDAALPIVVPLLGISLLQFRWQTWFEKWKVLIGAAATLVMLSQLAWQVRGHLEERPPAAVRQSMAWSAMDSPDLQNWKREQYRDWLKACAWIQDNSGRNTVWLTPRNQQTFKWYAQRAEVANWKDVPQDAASIIRWRHLIRDVYEYQVMGPLNLTDDELQDLVSDYQIDYLMVEKRNVVLRERIGAPLPFRQVYPESGRDSEYLIFQVDR